MARLQSGAASGPPKGHAAGTQCLGRLAEGRSPAQATWKAAPCSTWEGQRSGPACWVAAAVAAAGVWGTFRNGARQTSWATESSGTRSFSA